jgi:hypothetical protein
LTPGILPFAATRPVALFAPLLRRSARAKKKVTKKESTLRGPQVLRWEVRKGCADANYVFVEAA